MTLQLSEIDYPPCWPDRHKLRITADGCMLTDAQPGDLQMWIDEPSFIEAIFAWYDDAPDDFMGLWLHADLSEAVDDFIAARPEPEQMLDWAMHLEMLAAKMRGASGCNKGDAV